ncbi:MAG TPA: ATP-binding protein [Solirubrobacteraceae bacterium]
MAADNPFRFGSLALDDAFTDRVEELDELVSDVLSGQDVVLFAPRRFGKTSLMWRAAQLLLRRRVLVAQVDLMTTPTKEKLAEKLAQAIHDDIASPLFRAKERLRVFQGLRVTPVVTVDPDDGSLGFAFDAGHRRQDIDATLERLLELPAQLAGDRGRKVALVLDEFQEVVHIDRQLPKLMRAVFQTQPEVAHVYLGSQRHMLARVFSDENEPFWRSAKRMELGPIAPEAFAPFIDARFAATGRAVPPEVVAAILELTRGQPYATQELCHFLWQETRARSRATPERLDAALARLLRSEHSHFSLIWQRATGPQRQVLQALAAEPGPVYGEDYRRRHGLPSASGVQRAVGALEDQELVARGPAGHEICEPFLAAWVRREQT